MVDKGVTGLAALRLPFGAPQRQLGFLPDFSWGVVLHFSVLPPPSPTGALLDKVGTGLGGGVGLALRFIAPFYLCAARAEGGGISCNLRAEAVPAGKIAPAPLTIGGLDPLIQLRAARKNVGLPPQRAAMVKLP